ncbi:MAG: helix-turn-helix domain-containing protein [Actinomycetota bacterium]
MGTAPDQPPPNPTARGGRPRAGTGLTAERMAEAALAVVGANGADALTRRLVADELGVSVRALYRLAPTTEHLLAAAGARWQETWPPPPDTGDWAADLRLWCQWTLTHASAYAGLTTATRRVPPELIEDRSEPVVTAVLRLLERAGFDRATAIDLFGVLSMHCLGWAVVFPPDLDPPTLDPSVEVPWLAEHLDFRQRGFLVGLDVLLDGMERRRSQPR